jgi:hypothetical protein
VKTFLPKFTSALLVLSALVVSTSVAHADITGETVSKQQNNPSAPPQTVISIVYRVDGLTSSAAMTATVSRSYSPTVLSPLTYRGLMSGLGNVNAPGGIGLGPGVWSEQYVGPYMYRVTLKATGQILDYETKPAP